MSSRAPAMPATDKSTSQLALFREPVKAIFGEVRAGEFAWIIDAQPFVMERVRRLFLYGRDGGRGKYTHSVWMVRTTLDVARDLVWLMGRYGFKVEPKLLSEIEAKAEKHDRISSVMAECDTDTLFVLTNSALKMAEPPRPHQVGFRNAFREIGRMLLGDDIGLGKTISAISILCEPSARPALVVVPAHLPHQWLKQLKRFLPDASAHIIKGTKPYDLPSVDVLITTYPRLSGWQDRLPKMGIRTVVFDEVQDLRKVDTAKRTAARAISMVCEYCVGLSATPIYNLGSEVWSVLDVIAPESLGTMGSFTREWCVGGGSVSNPLALHTFLKDQGLFIRRTKKDLGIESEPVSREVITLDGDLESLKKVQNVAKALALSVLSNVVGESSRSAMELDWKLRQATGVAKARAAAHFVRMLVESGRKVFLAGWHREVYDIWMKEMADLSPVLYTGSESPAQKTAAVQALVTGKSKVFICSLRSGAGLDGLQHVCSDVVFGELDWSPQVMEQVIGRLDREGQQNPVTAYFLTIDDGSDPFILDVLSEKRAQHDGIVDGREAEVSILAGSGVGHGDRIRELAESYLASTGEAAPEKNPETGLHAEVVKALRRLNVSVTSEKEMQEGIWAVLPDLIPGAVEIQREVRIGERSRLDFLVTQAEERIAIECKMDQGGRAAVYRQVKRYAEEANVTGVVLFAPWPGVASFVVEGVRVSVVDFTKAGLIGRAA